MKGWIHAVYTPQDSLVFGGNFLNLLCCKLQISARAQEVALKIPGEKCFPFFDETMWYAAKKYILMLREEPAIFSSNELACLLQVCDYLRNNLKTSFDGEIDEIKFIEQDSKDSKISYLAKCLLLELYLRLDMLTEGKILQKEAILYPENIDLREFQLITEMQFRNTFQNYQELVWEHESDEKVDENQRKGCRFCNSDILRSKA